MDIDKSIIFYKIEEEKKFWESRLKLFDGIFYRIFKVLNLYCKGHYSRYSSNKSAIKDIFLL